MTARGWAYNVFNITNTQTANYTFQLQGESVGSQGAPSYFVGRLVVVNNDGPIYHEMEMSDSVTGTALVSVTSDDFQIFMIVASVPEYFESYQHYPYQVKISMSEY